MTAKEMIEALDRDGVTMYRVSVDTLIPRATLSRWRAEKARPTPILLGILKTYYQTKTGEKI